MSDTTGKIGWIEMIVDVTPGFRGFPVSAALFQA